MTVSTLLSHFIQKASKSNTKIIYKELMLIVSHMEILLLTNHQGTVRRVSSGEKQQAGRPLSCKTNGF